jgi:hypothetical protein
MQVLATMVAVAIQAAGPAAARPMDLFECRIPPDATAADLAPEGLLLVGETIDHLAAEHR